MTMIATLAAMVPSLNRKLTKPMTSEESQLTCYVLPFFSSNLFAGRDFSLLIKVLLVVLTYY